MVHQVFFGQRNAFDSRERFPRFRAVILSIKINFISARIVVRFRLFFQHFLQLFRLKMQVIQGLFAQLLGVCLKTTGGGRIEPTDNGLQTVPLDRLGTPPKTPFRENFCAVFSEENSLCFLGLFRYRHSRFPCRWNRPPQSAVSGSISSALGRGPAGFQ